MTICRVTNHCSRSVFVRAVAKASCRRVSLTDVKAANLSAASQGSFESERN
jgi:hypothetical protein